MDKVSADDGAFERLASELDYCIGTEMRFVDILACRHCGEELIHDRKVVGTDELARRAASEGWKMSNDRPVCPACQQMVKEEEAREQS